MSDAAKEWDERYRQGRGMPDEPSALLVGGRGGGVPPVAVALCREKAARLGLAVEAVVADLEDYRLPANRYDLIINFHYLQRSLAGPIVRALKRGGVLFFESFTVDQLQYGYGPKDPAFLMLP